MNSKFIVQSLLVYTLGFFFKIIVSVMGISRQRVYIL